MNIEKILEHYLMCALWSSVDNNDNSFDKNYTIDDINQESKEKAKADIVLFVEKSGNLLDEMTEENIGHDFWLTRNHHGAGFWENDNENIGNTLTKISYDFGECNLYIDDNNEISFI